MSQDFGNSEISFGADVVNDAAAELALDPSADHSSSGVSIRQGPMPASPKPSEDQALARPPHQPEPAEQPKEG